MYIESYISPEFLGMLDCIDQASFSKLENIAKPALPFVLRSMNDRVCWIDVVGRSVDPLVSLLVCWLVFWLVYWSDSRSVGRSVGRLVCLSVRNSKPKNNAKTPACWIASKFALNSKQENNAKHLYVG